MSDQESEVRILITGDALAETGRKTQEGTKAAEGHAKALHGMGRVFNALNQVVPGLGVAMQAAWTNFNAALGR